MATGPDGKDKGEDRVAANVNAIVEEEVGPELTVGDGGEGGGNVNGEEPPPTQLRNDETLKEGEQGTELGGDEKKGPLFQNAGRGGGAASPQ